MTILTLKGAPNPISGDRAGSWDLISLTNTQAHSDCNTKLFLSYFLKNCNLEQYICCLVKSFPCGHCSWTWSLWNIWKEEVERVAWNCWLLDTYNACIFISTNRNAFKGPSLISLLLMLQRKKKSPVLMRIQVKARRITEQLKKILRLWDFVPASTSIWEKKFI